ncbi:hypothetical protein Vretimale_16129 [Volvox reticuliferus]|uniref:Vacuolar protein sorting protein 11 C-terminal domain-containing protein n=1 Tax=Volvox reticuliferus TaxID=1737510 RepID=A0A8J4LWD9_9CHLO|nr:hypothetical protein Vretimale_16129 [Volvox reticuliferus]
MSFAFKRFNFFQPQQVLRHGFPPNASCVVPGGSLLWAGTESGSVCVLDSRLSLIGSFNAHGHKVLEILWLERRHLLVTVGIEEPGCSSTTVKLWSGEKLVAAAAAVMDGGGAGGQVGSSGASAATGPSSLAGIAASMTALKVTKVFGYHSGQQYPESPVTAAAAAEGGSNGTGLTGLTGTSSGSGSGAGGADATSSLTVALGLASGSVVVLVGEVHAAPAAGGTPRAKLSHSRRLSARPDEGDFLSVTGLELTGTSDLLSLFVVTESQTLCFHLQTNTKTVLDPQGSPAPRCCCLRPGGSLLTVARSEGLYDYTADTRAGCTVFEGTKQRLTTFGRYLVVVTRDDSPSAASSNLLSGGGLGLGLVGVSPLNVGVGVGGAGNFGGGAAGVGSSCLQLADVRTKLLAGTFVLQGLQHVFCAWGAVYAVTAGVVWSYREIDLAAQLEALLRRSLHKLALDVARAWGSGAADEATLANIHQRWGDHLYSKGEYDAAMTQYLETIGQLEPSYVIRRFLDAQRIHNLTAYLELMHERGLATCDHTTLLLNCYTKLKDVSKLDAFIRRGGVSSAAPHTTNSAAITATNVSSAGAATGVDGSPAVATAAVAAAVSDSSLVRRPRRHLTSAAAAAAAEAVTDRADKAAVLGSGAAGNSRKQKQADPLASASASSAGASLRFDPDTAIRVLRGAGYSEHALWVADAAGQIDAVLDILLDELGDADEAITYLEMLPRKRRAEALKKYGKALIGMRAEAATGLIMDLCCGPPPGQQVHGGGAATAGPSYYLASVSDFAHLYSGEPTALMLLCEYILNTNAAVAAAAHAHTHAGGAGASDENDGGGAMPPARAYERLLYHTLLELYLADHLWQRSSQESNPHPPQPPQQSEQSQRPEKHGPKQQPKGKSQPQALTPQQPYQQQQKVVHPAMVTAASSPAVAAVKSGPGAAVAHDSGGVTAAPQGEAMSVPTGAEKTANGGEGTACSPTTAAMAGPSDSNGTAPHHHHHSTGGAPGPTTGATVAVTAGGPASPDTEARHAKALDLLARGWPPHVHLPDPSSGAAYDTYGPAYDPDHALVLCRLHGFRKGLLFLYDRLRLPREALQVYMSGGDHAGLISAVLKYGDASRGGDPVLWSEVLEYFVSQHDANPPASDCSTQIMQVVEHVERSGVLPPLVVLQTLSRSRRLPLSLIRGYMERALQRDTAAVARDREAVSRLAAETAALREEVTKLRTQPRLFQNSRCSASGAPLELPVVHFLCGHSFNLRQLGENDRECPLCGPDQRRVAEIRHSMQAASMQPERFFAELRQATDGFSVVAEHFGRGLMNVTPAAAAAGAAAAVGQPALLL